MTAFLDRLRLSKIATNFGHMLFGNLALVGFQAIQFVFLARILGPEQFGMYASTAALIMVVMPFAGFGMANVTVMRGARDASVIPIYLAASLVATMFSGVLLSVALYGGLPIILGTSTTLTLIGALCIAELVFSKCIDACGHAFIAAEELRWTSALMLAPALLRLGGLALLAYMGWTEVDSWAVLFLAAHFLACALAVFVALRRFGFEPFHFEVIAKEWKDGVYFALGLSSKSVYTDGDKAVVGSLAGAEAAGVYTAGYRFIQMALVPVRALALASQARYFATGAHGVGGAWIFGVRMLKLTGVYGFAIGVLLWLGAPFAIWILGPQYADAAQWIQWMAGLPALFAAQTVLADVLSGGGQQRLRSLIQLTAAVIAACLSIVLVGPYGPAGAITASYTAQLFLVGALAYAIRVSTGSDSGCSREGVADTTVKRVRRS